MTQAATRASHKGVCVCLKPEHIQILTYLSAIIQQLNLQLLFRYDFVRHCAVQYKVRFIYLRENLTSGSGGRSMIMFTLITNTKRWTGHTRTGCEDLL